MKKWIYISVVEFVIIAISAVFILLSFSTPKVEYLDLTEYLSEFQESNNYVPTAGYINNAKTAKIACSCILGELIEDKGIGVSSVTVEYDADNRLWKVEKNYLFGRGGFVVIEQDTGKVVKALLTK